VPTARQINSLDQLRALEKELLAQIAAYPNGGRLFLCDPLRVLAEFGVTLAPSSCAAWTKLLNDPTALAGDHAGLYDAIKATAPTTGEIRIRALLPPAPTRRSNPRPSSAIQVGCCNSMLTRFANSSSAP